MPRRALSAAGGKRLACASAQRSRRLAAGRDGRLALQAASGLPGRALSVPGGWWLWASRRFAGFLGSRSSQEPPEGLRKAQGSPRSSLELSGASFRKIRFFPGHPKEKGFESTRAAWATQVAAANSRVLGFTLDRFSHSEWLSWRRDRVFLMEQDASYKMRCWTLSFRAKSEK